jgi:hypothetical protein
MFRPIRFLSTHQPDSVDGDFDVLCNGAAVVARPAENELFNSLRQLVVFSLNSFVHEPVRSRIERFEPAIIAGANQDRDSAVDVSFVAPLPKCHFFHVLSHAPLFTDFTNGGFVVGGHRPIPSASPKPGHCDKVFAVHPQRLDRNRLRCH